LVPEAFSIGRLAALTGLPVKTIRFYSDAGLLPPSGRTEAGHRRYTATDVARLQLVRTLRDLDVPLGTVGQLPAGRRGLGELLAAHVTALQARDQALHRQLAVVRAAAAVSPMARGFAELLGRRDSPAFRRWLVEQLDAHTDPRAERYWELVGIVQDRPDEELTARVADHAWLLAALRHHQDRPGVPA
jgi:DNA-binding transcriptional MerR regulator